MSKKSKNKGNNRPSPAKVQPAVSAAKAVTDDQVKRIAELKEAVDQKMEGSGLEAENLSEEDAAKVVEAEKNNDLKKYLKELEDIHRQLIPLRREAETLRETAQKEREKIQKEKEEFETSKKALEDLTEEVNKKRKEVDERAFKLDNGEYTGTIHSLLNALEESEQLIADETKKLIDDIAEKHKTLLEKEKELGESTFNLEEEKNALEQEKRKLAKQVRNLEADKKMFREEAREELEAEYSGKYEDEKSKASRLQARNQFLEEKITELETLRSSLFVTFGDKEPADILSEVDKIRKEVVELKEELNKRPTEDDLETKRQENSELEAKLNRLRGLVNEQEISELRTRINNADSYIIEIQSYKDRLESADNREASLKRTIEDLQKTVEQLKGETKKEYYAFQKAREYDADVSLQHKGFKDINPNNLADFALYIQHKIASAEKPFYYDLETIRVFIAGLYMSNITILQGISGTGKTSLPIEFAKAIISEAIEYRGHTSENYSNSPFRVCAVQSGWRDNMDLMGYYNSFEHKYKETDFFKALYVANLPKYSDTLFFIILDEMNLSRPEHYFADFLSILERDEKDRYIYVDGKKDIYPDMIKEGSLMVPGNVRFIGTANHDETTLEFAPKTYDRSNLMEMPKNRASGITRTDISYNVSYKWLKESFDASIPVYVDEFNKFKDFLNSPKVKKLLDAKDIGVGNRFEDQAKRFICAFIATGDPQNKEESLAMAADHLITTRLFRSLKNRYDLEKSKLQTFQRAFVELFIDTFNEEPKHAYELLEEEIRKKTKETDENL